MLCLRTVHLHLWIPTVTSKHAACMFMYSSVKISDAKICKMLVFITKNLLSVWLSRWPIVDGRTDRKLWAKIFDFHSDFLLRPVPFNSPLDLLNEKNGYPSKLLRETHHKVWRPSTCTMGVNVHLAMTYIQQPRLPKLAVLDFSLLRLKL